MAQDLQEANEEVRDIQINIQGKYDRSFLIKEHNMGFWVKAEADGREYVYDQKY